jgi:hypothetical protein
MQCEKASGWEFTDGGFVDVPAFDAPPEPVDGELPPHAAASRAKAAVATMAARTVSRRRIRIMAALLRRGR